MNEPERSEPASLPYETTASVPADTASLGERIAAWKACQRCAEVSDPCEAHAVDPYPANLFPHGLVFMSRVTPPDEMDRA